MKRDPKPPSVAGLLYRLSAFGSGDGGGNPAGVWLGDALPEAAAMQRIASEVGYSETAFVAPRAGPRRTVRYFSPAAEVAFCGHATIAAGVVLGETDGDGRFVLDTRVGAVEVEVEPRDGVREARLTSVATRHRPVAAALLDEVLALLDWRREDLDPAIPPASAYAGAWHLVLAVAQRERLATLDYPFASMKALMLEAGWTTLQLVWRERDDLFHARNPFAVGDVVEDPATGAAAAALGGYLRDAGLLHAPARLSIRQGEAMGRPSRLRVEIPAQGGIVVSGPAVAIAPPQPCG
jgi:PhzF family phenazine biosynthesis protein